MYNTQPANMIASVDERQFIRGVPHQVPFVPQVPVNNPQLQQFVPNVVGYVIHEIQANAKKNALRAQYYLACSQNNWNSQQFNQAVAMALEIVDLKLTMERIPIQQAIPEAANIVVSILATLLAKDTGMLARDPSFTESAGRTLQLAEALKNQLAQMYTHRQMQQQQMSMGYQQMPGMMGQMPQMMGMPGMFPQMMQPMMGGVGGMSGTIPYNPAAAHMHGVAGRIPNAFTTNVPTHNAPSSGFVGVFNRPVVDDIDPPMTRPIEEAVYMNESRTPPLAGAFKPLHRQAPTEHTQAPTKAPAPSEQPKVEFDKLRPYDRVELSNGAVVVPAVLHPDLKPTLNIEHPYRRVYDIDKSVLFYVITETDSHRQVFENLQPRTEEMNYLEHELNARMRENIREQETAVAGRKVVPDWSLATAFKPHPNLPLSSKEFNPESIESDEGEGTELESIDISDRIDTVASLSDAQFKAAMYAGEAVAENQAFESYFDIAEKLTITEEQLNQILTLFRSENYDFEHVRRTLIKIREQDIFELDCNKDAFVSSIDKLFTDEINRILMQDLSLDEWAIDSFIDDLIPLRTLISDKLNNDYLDIFDDCAKKTIDMFFGVSVGSKYVGIAYRAAILWVPWTTGDLRIDFNGGGMIPQDSCQDLYHAAKEMVERDSEFNATRFFIYTEDGKLFEIRKGLLAKDCYLINQIQD